MPIRIANVKCADCGGEVTGFVVPDKVWRALGLTRQWVCLKCVAYRVNPTICVENLSQEIDRQRTRFNLQDINRYRGTPLPFTQVLIAEPGREGLILTYER